MPSSRTAECADSIDTALPIVDIESEVRGAARLRAAIGQRSATVPGCGGSLV